MQEAGAGRTGRFAGGVARLHFALVLLAPATMLVPLQGPMLIVPLLPGRDGSLPGWLQQDDARLLAPGPVSGSFLIDSDNTGLWARALMNGAVLIRARFAGCGDAGQEPR